MLIIRLKRIGKRRHPTFRFIISERRKDTKGDFLEDLGSYDPHTTPSTTQVKQDRVAYWLSQGAKTSATVFNLLVQAGVIQAEKKRAWKPKKKEHEAEAKETLPTASEKEEKPEEKVTKKESETNAAVAKPTPLPEATEPKETKVPEKVEELDSKKPTGAAAAGG